MNNELAQLLREAASELRENIEQQYGHSLEYPSYRRKYDAAMELPNNMDAAAASLEAQEPEGWKLVPVRPTDEMLQAVTGVHPGMRYANRDNAELWDSAYDNYVSMLAAAPQQGGGDAE